MKYVLQVLACLAMAPLAALGAEAIVIGGSMSLTGPLAEGGEQQYRAYRLWADKVNREGGLLGRPVRLLIRDDGSVPAAAAKMYQTLIAEDRVDLVFGPYSSPMVEAVAPVTEKLGYPMLVSAAAEPLYQKGYRQIFGVAVNASKYNVSFLELAVKEGIGSIAVISADDVFSTSVAQGTLEWAKRFGVKVAFYQKFPRGAKDLGALVRAARASGAEVLVVCGFFDESVNAHQALKAAAWKPRAFLATVGPGLQKYRDVMKGEEELTMTPSQWEPVSAYPGSREFVADYRRAYGVEPAYQAAIAYSCAQVLQTAIVQTGGVDRAKLRGALLSLDVFTVMGRYGVDQTGRQIRQIAVTVQWQNGAKVIVAPPELMTAPARWNPPAHPPQTPPR